MEVGRRVEGGGGSLSASKIVVCLFIQHEKFVGKKQQEIRNQNADKAINAWLNLIRNNEHIGFQLTWNLFNTMVVNTALYGSEIAEWDEQGWESVRRKALSKYYGLKSTGSMLGMEAITPCVPFQIHAMSNQIKSIKRCKDMHKETIARNAIEENMKSNKEGWYAKVTARIKERLPEMEIQWENNEDEEVEEGLIQNRKATEFAQKESKEDSIKMALYREWNRAIREILDNRNQVWNISGFITRMMNDENWIIKENITMKGKENKLGPEAVKIACSRLVQQQDKPMFIGTISLPDLKKMNLKKHFLALPACLPARMPACLLACLLACLCLLVLSCACLCLLVHVLVCFCLLLPAFACSRLLFHAFACLLSCLLACLQKNVFF